MLHTIGFLGFYVNNFLFKFQKTEDGNGSESQETEKKIVVTAPPARESLSVQDELFTNEDIEMEDLETFGQGIFY